MASSINTSPIKNDVKPVELKWISRANKTPKKHHSKTKKTQSNTSKKQLNVSTQKKINNFFSASPKHKIINNHKSPVKKHTETTNNDLYLSPSAKLDSLVPKVEDLLKARENDEKFKKIHEIIAESSKRFLENLNNSGNDDCETKQKTTKKVKFNHCKHLTNAQITKKFKKDVKYIDDIFYGRVFNERYELFKNDTPLNNGTRNDLRVNEINIAFTQDQLIHVISLFRERYDQGNIYKYSDFYFKVLLPEYCLKIYSDVYKTTTKDALDYLKSVPVHDLII